MATEKQSARERDERRNAEEAASLVAEAARRDEEEGAVLAAEAARHRWRVEAMRLPAGHVRQNLHDLTERRTVDGGVLLLTQAELRELSLCAKSPTRSS